MNSAQCPACRSSAIVGGRILNSQLSLDGLGVSFFRGLPDLSTPERFLCCCACGHLWSTVSPQTLRKIIEAEGDELLKETVMRSEVGTPDDLLADTGARAAAAKVLEIDTLVTITRAPEAYRRYRELKPTTWDDAIRVVNTWRNLKRAEKLALFGWNLKNAALPASLGEKHHPLHDRELDG